MVALPEGYPRIELRDPTFTYGAPDGSELIDGRCGAIEFSEGGWSGFAGRACDLDAGQKRLYRPTLGFDARSARYWRIRIENYRPIPSWHGGAGSIPYLFVDEILFR